MSISALELLRTPKGYPPEWQRLFETFVSPITLVREIRARASRNALKDKAASKETEPWLSAEEFQRFRDEADGVGQRVWEAMERIHGVAEQTWRAACEIRSATGLVLFPLTDELSQKQYPEPVLAGIRRQIIEASLGFDEIPLLKMLRDAISAEKSITIPDPTRNTEPSQPTTVPTVDEEDERILKALAKHFPRRRSQEEIADDSSVSKKTIGQRLPDLLKGGWVVQPKGPKKGTAITDAGMDLLKRLMQIDAKSTP